MTQANEAAAGVTQEIFGEWHDGLARTSPFWQGVEKGDLREKKSGGLLLQFAIKAFKNQAQGFIPLVGANTNITPSIQFQFGQLNWKAHYTAINFTLYDEVVSGGSNDKIDYMAGKIQGSLSDSSREMAQYTYLGTYDVVDGTQGSNPLAWDGLEDVCVASGTAYAGLTDTDYTDDAAVYLPYISTDTQPVYGTIDDMVNEVKSRVQVSQFTPEKYWGIMGSKVFTRFKTLVQASQIFGPFLNTKDTWAVGFSGFNVDDVDFYLDAYCTGTNTAGSSNNRIFIVPMDVFKFHYRFGFDVDCPMDTEEMRIPTNPVISTQKFTVGNWVCEDRRLVAVNKSIKI